MNKSILIAFFFFTVAANAQSDNGLLEWNEFYKLSWEDFQAQALDGTFGDAGTAVQIKAKPYLVDKKVHYDVVAYFDRSKSWSRDRSDALLAHEQLHFHLAELYARKIRQKIDALADAGEDDLEVYNAAVRKILIESNEADERYDRETLHGALPKRQEAWKSQVEEELKALSDFKKKKKIIGSVQRLKKQPTIFKKN